MPQLRFTLVQMSDSTCENDSSHLNVTACNSVASEAVLPSSKPQSVLLTQEFNSIPSATASTVTTANNTISDNSAFSCASLPFVLSPETTSANNTFIPKIPLQSIPSGAPAFIYHPFPVYSPEQYFLMMQKQQQTNKRVKIALEPENDSNPSSNTNNNNNSVSAIIDQLNSFKTSLKSSFDRNLQKLEVLDRLVQTVTIKGSIQLDSLQGLLEIIQSCRLLLKELVFEQVDMTAVLSAEIKNSLLPGLLGTLKHLSLIDNTKNELVDKLRKEEDSHLTDLTILSTRNKELQKDVRVIKEQFDRLQVEYSDSLKSAAFERDEHEQFVSQLMQCLGLKDSQANAHRLLDEIENLLQQQEENNIKNTSMKDQILHLLEELEAIKGNIMTSVPVPDYSALLNELVMFSVNSVTDRFEVILHERERFYNDFLNFLTRKFEELIKNQSKLAHESLNARIGLQGQLADSLENSARLRKHCQKLTTELNQTAAEIDKKLVLMQLKDSELAETKRRNELTSEKIRLLEQELSVKNQENRTLGIRIQSLQNELEEAETKHRHDLAALERKISILESKQREQEAAAARMQNEKDLKDIINIDPFSSITKQPEKIVEDDNDVLEDSVSEIPPTMALPSKKKVVITFTGIRDSGKQKDLTKYLNDLGAIVHVGADFNDEITHVLAPRGYRSIRVLAASLTGKWIVSVDWVEACRRTGQFVSELLHGGFCNSTVRPFRFRTLWMSAAFSVTHKSHPTYPTAALRTLLEKLGKARWCEMAGQADFLLVTEEEKEDNLITSNRGGILLTLNNLINMIPIE